MRKLLLLLPFLVFFSCKKASDISDLKNSISGTWELEKFSGFTSYSLPPGNGQVIIIRKNGTFQRMQHDTLLFSGSYALSKKKDCYSRNSNIIFSTNEYPSVNYSYIELIDDNLTLSTPNCYMDGGTAYYHRVE